jgi:hypothetical protein
MVTDGHFDHAAYIFSPDASYGLVSELRHSGLPSGVHFVASVTGPWQIVAIAEFDDLTELPGIVESLFGGGSGGASSADPPTAYAFSFNAIKHSVYADQMALVRMDIAGVGNDDLPGLLEEIEGTIGSPEVNAVFGDFDILACVAGDDVDAVKARIFELRGNGAIVSTLTLWIIDYVTADTDAPKAFRRGLRKG